MDHNLESLKVSELSSSLSLSDLLSPAGLGPLGESRRSLDLSLEVVDLDASGHALNNVGSEGDVLEVDNLSGDTGGGAIDEDLLLVFCVLKAVRFGWGVFWGSGHHRYAVATFWLPQIHCHRHTVTLCVVFLCALKHILSNSTHSSVVDNLGDDGKLADDRLVVGSVDENDSASLDQSPVNALHFGHCCMSVCVDVRLDKNSKARC